MPMRGPRSLETGTRTRAVAACAFAAVTALVGACLPEQKEIEGQQIFAGRGIENVSFVAVRGKTHVLYEVRRQLGSPSGPGRTDLWIVPLDGSAPARMFFAGRSDVATTAGLGGDPPQYWVATNPREAAVGRRSVTVTDRVRVDSDGTVHEIVNGTSQFQLLGGGWKFFQRPIPNQAAVGYHIRDELGTERVLTDVTGPVQFYAKGFFYVGGPELTLYWVPNLNAPAEPLRSGVTRMRLRPDLNLAVLTVPQDGRPSDIVFDLLRKTERQLPGKNICCWLDFPSADSTVWRYAEARTPDSPARYHQYDLGDGAHVARDLPAMMADLISIQGRPASEDELYSDSQGTLSLFTANPEPAVTVLPLKAPAPRFTSDGRYLLYVEPTSLVPSPEGPLMIQDVAFASPRRQLSPLGTTLLISSFFTLDEPAPPVVVFWARFGRAASDLYFAPLDTPGVERVAEGIRDVSVTRTRVLGIVRTSLQDLVGDLVLKTLADQQETVLGRSADSFAVTQDLETKVTKVVYTLRTRKASGVEGLWVTELPPL